MMSVILHILATSIQHGDLPTAHATQGTIKKVLDIVFSVIGALALLMITASGLRYILAGGDQQKVAKAKNGIIYSLVGLLIAISAEAIVSFVVKRL